MDIRGHQDHIHLQNYQSYLLEAADFMFLLNSERNFCHCSEFLFLCKT